ncbi:MAG: hypothetical protein ACRELX_03440 [Longimicrobiales bacterium]
MLRDGEVHHEDLAAASVHEQSGAGEHGHEDGGFPERHEHGQDHEHGTSTDHCTHAHSAALVPTFSFTVLPGEAVTEYDEATQPHPILSRPFTHPPRP